MHSDPVHAPPTAVEPVVAEAWDEEVPSLGIGALLALVLFLLAASAYAEDSTETTVNIDSAGSIAPEVIEAPATAPLSTTSTANPLDPGTPPPADSEGTSEGTAEKTGTAVTDAAPSETPNDAPPAPPAVESAPVADAGNSDAAPNSSETKIEKRHPEYQTHRPNFGLAISATPTAGVVGSLFSGANFESAYRAFQFQAEYQPAFLQAIGVLGIGACGTIYRSFATPVVAPSPAEGISWSAGGQIRYQFRYWREQYVVPTISFGAEYMVYDLGGTNTGSLVLMYPGGGLMLSLNWMEREAAAEGYASSGVSRSYLWGEARYQIASGTFSESGLVAVAGIRVEL